MTIDSGIRERTAWLINLRWLACTGLFSASLIASIFFKIKLHYAPIFSIAVLIGLYNAVVGILVKRTSGNRNGGAAHTLFLIDNLQISLDLICLAVLIHFTGGIENPFLFYFIFHTIIASILLTRLNALFQVSLTAVLFLSIALFESTGALAHHPIEGFLPAPLYNSRSYIIAISFVFLSTLYIALYLASSISKKLLDREKKLEDVNKQLEEKDRIKSEYVLRVSHDIKGHIAAIQSSIDPVRAGITGALNPGQKNLLDRADERSAKLMSFVKSLLNLTIMRLKDSDDIVTFNLVEEALGAVDFVRAEAKEKGITLKVVPSEMLFGIKASKSEMKATIIELLSNAIRYTLRGGTITLSCYKNEREFIVEIQDNGIGIPAKDTEKIFSEFYRASNARIADSSSSGLGLAMVKHTVEKAGGKIWVESIEGEGSTFYIEFPKVT